MLDSLEAAGKGLYKGCVAAEEQNDLEAAQQAVSFGRTVEGIFSSKKFWHVTMIGSPEYPSIMICN